MDIDFHYYATYVAACFAGYDQKSASTIATSAQMIDENSRHVLVENTGTTTGMMGFPDDFSLHHHADGPSIHTYRVQMTFQGLADIGTSSVDTLSSIWPVYHFLPGNFTSRFNSDRWQQRTLNDALQTDTNVKQHFEWLCRPHSAMAIRLINNCKDLIHDTNSVINKHQLANYLIGVTAHVFADTWAHQDFVGFGVRQINSRSEIEEKKGDDYHFGSHRNWDLSYAFLNPKNVSDFPTLVGSTEKEYNQHIQTQWKHSDWKDCAPPVLSRVTDNAAIGHGIVGHLPDHSSLLWRYKPVWSSSEITRNNPVEYFDAFVHLVWAMRCIRLNQEYSPFDVKPQEIAGKIGVNPAHLLAVYEVLTQERHPWCSGTEKNVRATENVNIQDSWDGMIFIHGFQWQGLIKELGLNPIDSWIPLQSDWIKTAYQIYKNNQEVKKGNWFTVQQFKSLDFFKFNIAAKFHYRFVKQELLANGKLLLGNWADGAAYADDLERISHNVTFYEIWRQTLINELSDLQRTERIREVNEGITILIRDIEVADSLPSVYLILTNLAKRVNSKATWTYGILNEQGAIQSPIAVQTINKIITNYNNLAGTVVDSLAEGVRSVLIEYDKHTKKLFSNPSELSIQAARYLDGRLNERVSETELADCLSYLLGLSSKRSVSRSFLVPLKKDSKLYSLLYNAYIKSAR